MTKERSIIELFKLIGISFQNMHLKTQNVRRSDTNFNGKKNIAKSNFHRYKKTATNEVYSAKRFELLHGETTENNNNSQPSDKNISIFKQVSSVWVSPNTKHQQSKGTKVVIKRLPQNQHKFHKNYIVPGEKHINSISSRENKYYSKELCYCYCL